MMSDENNTPIDEIENQDEIQPAQKETPKEPLPIYHGEEQQVMAVKVSKVETLEDESGLIFPKEHGINPIIVTKEYMEEHEPQEGGFYVRDDKGNESFSSADDFKEEFTSMENLRGVPVTFGK